MNEEEKFSAETFFPARILYSFLAAVRFLTILPISWKTDQDHDHLKSSLYFFPAVGALIGITVGGISMLLVQFLPFTVVSVIVIILLAGFSGCLHIDGLADSCDGLFSARPRTKMLVIMRDSNIGAMGVIGIVSVILLKFSAVNSLEPSMLFITIVLMGIAGRVSMLIMIAVLPYVRGKDGIGTSFLHENSQNIWKAAVAGLFWLLICLFFFPARTILAAVVSTLIIVFAFSWYCRKMIGGFTGDTLGAVCELSEMAVAVSMVSFLSTS